MSNDKSARAAKRVYRQVKKDDEFGGLRREGDLASHIIRRDDTGNDDCSKVKYTSSRKQRIMVKTTKPKWYAVSTCHIAHMQK